MKLITAKVTLEYYAGVKPVWWIADAIKDINNAMEEILRRYGDEEE